MLMPTEKPGYFSFVLTEDRIDFERLAADEDALRERFYKHVQRQDLTFGRLEAVSPWRYDTCHLIRCCVTRTGCNTGPTSAWWTGSEMEGSSLPAVSPLPLVDELGIAHKLIDAAHVHAPAGGQV